MPRLPSTLSALPALVASVLVGCDITLPWTPSTPPPPTLGARLESPALELTLGTDVQFPPPMTLIVTATRAFEAFLDGGGLTEPAIAGPGTRVELHVVPRRPSELGVGVHQGELIIWLSVEQDGVRVEARDSPLRVPFTYRITDPPLRVLPPQVQLSHVVGATPPEVMLELDGLADAGPWSAESSEDWLSLEPASGTGVPALVRVKVTADLTSTSGAALTFHRRGSTVVVEVSVLVERPALVVLGDPVEVRWLQGRGGLPPPVEVPIDTETGGTCAYSAFAWIAYGSAPAGWLAVESEQNVAPGALRLRVTRADFPPGTYDGQVDLVTNCRGHGSRIPVRLVLEEGPVAVPMAPLGFVLDWNTPATGDRLELVVTSSAPGVQVAARAEGGWLRVEPESGIPSPTLGFTIRVDLEEIGRGPQGERSGAVVFSFTTPEGVTAERRVLVTGWVAFPEVLSVEPRAIVGGPVTAHLTSWFAAPCDGAHPLAFGDAPTAASTCFGSIVRADPPALGPGDHPVWVWNPLGLRRPGPVLRVLDPAPLPATSTATPGLTSRVIVDGFGGTVWTVHPSAARLVRHQPGGTWRSDSVELPGLLDVTPLPGGRRLLALTGTGTTYVDAASLALAQVATSFELPAAGGWAWTLAAQREVGAFAVTSEHAACVAANPPCRSHFVLPDGQLAPYAPFFGARVASSQDYTRTVAVRHGFQPPRPLFVIGSDQAGEVPGTDASATALALDRAGTRVLLLEAGPGGTASTLLAQDLTPIAGALPATTESAALSFDGARAFTFDGASRAVRVFDLATPAVAGAFVELAGPVVPAADPGASAVVALAADERTLFVAGDSRLVAVPLP